MLSNFLNRIKLPFRKEKELYVSLRQIIGFYPHDIELYKTALLHKSIARRNDKGKPVNNERLEFLGDAILDAVVGDIVFQHFPGKREGFLTNTRSKLVQRETLGRLAKEMGINDLVVSASRNQSHNSYMGGNAFEALVGAIYLDRGYDACMRFMQKRILSQLINIDKVAYKEVNFKSKLLEWTQKNRVRMEFQLLQQKKDDNGSPVFAYQVVIEGIKGASASGYSKKESQQMASKLTLEMLRKQPQFIDAIFAAKTDRTKMEEEPTMAVPSTEESQDFFINEDRQFNSDQRQETRSAEVKPKAENAKTVSAKAESPKPENGKADQQPQAEQPKQKPKRESKPRAEKQPKAENTKSENAKAQSVKAENDKTDQQPQAEQPKQKPKREPKPRAEKQSKAENAKSVNVKSESVKAENVKADQQPQAEQPKQKPKREPKPRTEKEPRASRQRASRELHDSDEQEQLRDFRMENEQAPAMTPNRPSANVPANTEEFDLSDISAREQSREEIIAAAEAAAFAESQG